MVDYSELMEILSIPRPNGSPAERDTAKRLYSWLSRRGIPYQIQAFRSYPHFFEAIGIWLIVSRTLLALSVWMRWGWYCLLIAGIGLVGGTLDVAFHIPTISRVGARRGENILLTFSPDHPKQELILSAHYDTKTEWLDHRQRMFLLKSLRFGIALSLLLGILGPLDQWLSASASPLAGLSYAISAFLTLPLLFLAWGLGLNLFTGRLLPQSQGAVDNGSACAILLGLGERLNTGELSLGQTKVTLALFTGEEVNMQGSRAYVRQRDWPLPTAALNLEVMAQDGDYVYWEQDGTVFGLLPASRELNTAIAQAVMALTGKPARPAGPITSDGGSFLSAGISGTTLGTYHSRLIDTGFHRVSDNLNRVVMDRLPEGVEILTCILKKIDQGGLQCAKSSQPLSSSSL